MQFAPDLRAAVADGDVTLTVRYWGRPRVKVGGRYRTAGVVIEVDTVELLPFAEIGDDDVARSGEPDREALRARTAHRGPVADDTLVHRVEFHVVDDAG